MNLCSLCRQDFTSVSAFDEHKTGRHNYTLSEGLAQEPPVEDGRRCLSTREMEDEGWTQDGNGRWRYPTDWQMRAGMWDAADFDVERLNV